MMLGIAEEEPAWGILVYWRRMVRGVILRLHFYACHQALGAFLGIGASSCIENSSGNRWGNRGGKRANEISAYYRELNQAKGKSKGLSKSAPCERASYSSSARHIDAAA